MCAPWRMTQTQLGCVVSANFTGDWIRADAAGTNFERSCAACHANVSCVAFSADTGSVGTPLTVRFDDVHPRRRRLQQQPPLESPPESPPGAASVAIVQLAWSSLVSTILMVGA